MASNGFLHIGRVSGVTQKFASDIMDIEEYQLSSQNDIGSYDEPTLDSISDLSDSIETIYFDSKSVEVCEAAISFYSISNTEVSAQNDNGSHFRKQHK